ncbi:putative NACHT, LRR and PYD domains-containing protein 12 [Penaeus vannamei]|uniref:Putative NACHT, LRR and PYD domains-containing protein 12 n=1 Tax=Penaeus vannamei TaxID=6689 RepID=A0A423SLA0_PENVA|nr:putative NACHT, LRR and PYD domains-containing protein 12 [Penaeus vannamei]
MVYIQLEIVEAGKGSKGQQVMYTDLFKNMCANLGGQPSDKANVILVEGPSGVGKTTLTRLLINGWSQGDSNIEGLEDFDILLFVECRVPHIEKFSELLVSLMPDFAITCDVDEMLKQLLRKKVLVIVDGLDEMNPSSKKLFQEILYKARTSNLIVLATTRAEALKTYYKIVPEGIYTTHIKIIGIPEDKREEFAVKYHEEMKKTKDYGCDTKGLIKYLHRMGINLTEYWRIPLHLAKLVMLWVLWPDILNAVTTAWLDILSNVKASDTITSLVSKYVPDVMNLKSHITITDAQVLVYSKLISRASPQKVTISLARSPSSVSNLQDLLKSMLPLKCIHAAAGVDLGSQPKLSTMNHILYEGREDSSVKLTIKKPTSGLINKTHLEDITDVLGDKKIVQVDLQLRDDWCLVTDQKIIRVTTTSRSSFDMSNLNEVVTFFMAHGNPKLKLYFKTKSQQHESTSTINEASRGSCSSQSTVARGTPYSAATLKDLISSLFMHISSLSVFTAQSPIIGAAQPPGQLGIMGSSGHRGPEI